MKIENVPLRLRLLGLLVDGGFGAGKLARLVSRPEKTVRACLLRLSNEGLVAKIGFPGVYELSEAGRLLVQKKGRFSKSVGRVKSENLPFGPKSIHSFRVKFALLDKLEVGTLRPLSIQPSFWDEFVQMNGWVQFVKRFPLKGLTVRVSHLAVEFWFDEVVLPLSDRLADKAWWALWSRGREVAEYLALRGLRFDYFGGRVLSVHDETGVKDVEVAEKLGSEGRTVLRLGYGARALWPSEEEARAWFDRSAGLEWGTNDRVYGRKFLNMPLRVEKLAKDFPLVVRSMEAAASASLKAAEGVRAAGEQNAWLAENLKTHKLVLDQMLLTLQAIQRSVEGRVL